MLRPKTYTERKKKAIPTLRWFAGYCKARFANIAKSQRWPEFFQQVGPMFVLWSLSTQEI